MCERTGNEPLGRIPLAFVLGARLDHVLEAGEHSDQRAELGADSEREQHEEEEYGPERREPEAIDRLCERDERQTGAGARLYEYICARTTAARRDTTTTKAFSRAANTKSFG